CVPAAIAPPPLRARPSAPPESLTDAARHGSAPARARPRSNGRYEGRRGVCRALACSREERRPMDREKLHRLLRLGIEKGASDIHLQVGYLPLYRFHGELIELRYKVFTAKDT